MSEEYTKHCLYSKLSYDTKEIGKGPKAPRVFRNAQLLTPGEWTDAGSRMPTVYTPQELTRSAENWRSNYLNVDHSWNSLDRIGYVNNPKAVRGSVKGDLFIYPITQTARDTISLIDSGLINWLSVELFSRDEINYDDRKIYASDITFIGAAVVSHPADENTYISADGPQYERITED